MSNKIIDLRHTYGQDYKSLTNFIQFEIHDMLDDLSFMHPFFQTHPIYLKRDCQVINQLGYLSPLIEDSDVEDFIMESYNFLGRMSADGQDHTLSEGKSIELGCQIIHRTLNFKETRGFEKFQKANPCFCPECMELQESKNDDLENEFYDQTSSNENSISDDNNVISFAKKKRNKTRKKK